jgi:hypothetical protein
MAALKRDTDPQVLDALGRIELRADECWRPLRILDYPVNTGLWALLVGGVAQAERAHAGAGSNTPPFDAVILNASRSLPIAMKWVAAHGRPSTTPVATAWTPDLGSAVVEALGTARQYFQFETCFPSFHKNVLAAELIEPALVRFVTGERGRERQVTAHRQGRRPAQTTGAELSSLGGPQVEPLVEAVLRSCRPTSSSGVTFADPWELWRALMPQCLERLRAVTRRSAEISLGAYRLSDFNEFFAALIAVCAAHDLLCFRWSRVAGSYPWDSSVLLRTRDSWAHTLAALSGVDLIKCQGMLSDLTFPLGRSGDLHIQPFVPTDEAAGMLALAPPFPMHARHDENILRVCSQLRPAVFSLASAQKEAEMLAEAEILRGSYGLSGPVPLPSPLPDVDLLVVDEADSTVAILELKWIRKTARPVELPDRDREVLKGIDQLQKIRKFLRETPGHLATLGVLRRSLSDYQNVRYILAARDHWRWVDPTDDMAIVDWEAFMAALAGTSRLRSALESLIRYDWLPVEGVDFQGRYQRATANEVSIESESLFAISH